MMNKNLYIFLIIAFSIISQSCDDSWDFDIPGCMDSNAINYDPNSTFDNGGCNYNIDEFYIDASSYDNWIYFSFELGEVVNVVDPYSSLEWDIAFRRNHMKTNGGISGPGYGCAIVDENYSWSNESFGSINQIPEYDCQEDDTIIGNIFTYQGCYNPNTHIFESCIKNPALDNWGWFNDSYTFNTTEYQFFVKSVMGNSYIKFWPKSYYGINGESGQILISYEIID